MKGFSARAVNRIKSSRAFTLAEALVAVIILLLVTAIVAAGIPAAARAYDRVVVASNAHVLLSTSMSSLRNELLTAKNVETEDDKSIIYYNESLGTESKIYSDPADGKIMIKRYAASEIISGAKDSQPEQLVSEEASDKDKGLYATFDTVSYDPEKQIITFHDLVVKDKNGNDTSATRSAYSIRVISSNGDVYSSGQEWDTTDNSSDDNSNDDSNSSNGD